MKHLKIHFWALLLMTGLIFSGCNILEVENPNSLVEEDLDRPVTAEFLVNGSEATLAEGLSGFLAPYSVASDEMVWTGSFDAWEDVMIGNYNDPTNQFVDQEYPDVSRARWWADDVIERLNEFDADGQLSDKTFLSRAYLYGAIIYVTIADMFDNFVFTERGQGGPPIGPENMVGLYDTANDYIDKGLAINGISDDLRAALLGMRARAHFSKAMWSKMRPVDTSDPLINNSDAATAAENALAVMSDDYKYQLEYSPSTLQNYLAQQMNQRTELLVNPSIYIFPSEDGRTIDDLSDPSTSIKLQDPIDDIPDPVLYDMLNEFVSSNEYAPMTVVSAREMHLILAESALAGNPSYNFEDQINAVRSLDSELSEYTGQIPEIEMLQYERQVNLFLQGKRLHDMFRFGISSPQWESGSTAANNPGTFFPIAITECRANPEVDC